jgi:hypothetical protein
MSAAGISIPSRAKRKVANLAGRESTHCSA